MPASHGQPKRGHHNGSNARVSTTGSSSAIQCRLPYQIRSRAQRSEHGLKARQSDAGIAVTEQPGKVSGRPWLALGTALRALGHGSLGQGCMVRAYFGSPGVLYARIRSTSRTLHTVLAGEALRLPPVVLWVPQYRTCPTRCGFHTMVRAPPQQVCATAYERSRVGLFRHGPDVHMCKEGFPRLS
eukprot:349894-Chlamydomonas_euryale.AAC.2